MNIKLQIILILILGISACKSCKEISMEPVFPKLKLFNKSEDKIIVFINIQYPDTTLKKSLKDKYLNPNEKDFIGHHWNLDQEEGITIFIFDYEYYISQKDVNIGTPDSYLDESKIKRKYVLSIDDLDSLKWELIYP